MKRILVVASLVVVGSGTALAADHIARIGEVMVSNQGTSSSQFIEIEDPNGESFPNTPYSLTLFNAAGVSIGSVALTVPAGTTRFLVATTTAATQFGVTAQATLNVTLPVDGQACFNNSSARIHCVAWGTITSQVIAPANNNLVATPPDGMSIQKIAGSYVLGTPSPGAANTSAVPDSAIDAGVTDAPGNTSQDALIGADAPTNGNDPVDDGDGCNVGASASWFGIVGLAALVLLRRRRS